MKIRTLPQTSAYVLVMVILVAASFVAGSTANGRQPANAQGTQAVALPASPDGGHVCTIGYVAVYDNRVQVWCQNAAGAISNFAAPFASATASRQTNRLLAVLLSAKALNKQAVLWFNDNPAANPPGCSAGDCRLLEGAVLQ